MNRRARDYPSARYGSTPVDGPFQGIGIKPHWEAMLYNYYRVLGWDVATGKPLPQTLQAVGLGHVIADLWCTRARMRFARTIPARTRSIAPL